MEWGGGGLKVCKNIRSRENVTEELAKGGWEKFEKKEGTLVYIEQEIKWMLEKKFKGIEKITKYE